MKPDISEFSYGYALTEDLIRWSHSPVTAAPVFPSLIEEGRPGGGYDVRIDRSGTPLFVQFKLTDCMVRRNARECAEGLLTPPFYRMHLRPLRHSRQHELLLDLESNGNDVFYAAPTFHTPSELNTAYLQHEVVSRSRFIQPSAIGHLPDDGAHHVAFGEDFHGWFLSRPVPLKKIFSGEQLGRELLRSIAEIESTALSEGRLLQLLDTMLTIVRKHQILRKRDAGVIDQMRQSKDSALSRIGFVAQTIFDCAFFLAHKRV